MQNASKIVWSDKPANISQYRLVVSEQYDSTDVTDIYLYTQDADNRTYFSLCRTITYSDEIRCIKNGYAPHIYFRIRKLVANRFHVYGGRDVHLVAILYD